MTASNELSQSRAEEAIRLSMETGNLVTIIASPEEFGPLADALFVRHPGDDHYGLDDGVEAFTGRVDGRWWTVHLVPATPKLTPPEPAPARRNPR